MIWLIWLASPKARIFFDNFRELIKNFEDKERRTMAERKTANIGNIDFATLSIPIFIIIALAIGLFLAWKIGNSIANPLIETTLAIQSLAREGANILLPDKGRADEIGILTKAFNSMVIQLEENESQIKVENMTRKKAEQEAVQANQVKSDFLAAMSHEIRTPMAGIAGMTDLLLGSKLSHQQMDWANSIQQSNTNLIRILSEILDQSKLEAGKLEISPADFHLVSMVENIAQMIEPSIHSKGLKLNIDIDKSIPEGVRSDPFRIGQILTNLISNALKFTEEGNITIKVAIDQSDSSGSDDSLDSPQKMLKFSVIDTGVGLVITPNKICLNPLPRLTVPHHANMAGQDWGYQFPNPWQN